MGGLVARSATYWLNTIHGRTSFVSGILTLGTPHLGIPEAQFLRLFPGEATEGTISLETGLSLRQIEEAPLFAFAGQLTYGLVERASGFCSGTTDIGYASDCAFIASPNDGLIEVSSAVPSFVSQGVAHTPFSNYDHSEMKDGDSDLTPPNDPLFIAIVADIERFAAQPPAAPTIALSSSSASFSAPAGGADPVPQSITITNSGTGTLSGLSASVSYQSGQPPGWLSASLDASTDPATLTLTATVGTLPAGTHNATIAIASSASGVTNSPQNVMVFFTVAPATIAFTSLTASNKHTCGLTAAGAAYCWGVNSLGGLGDGTGTDRTTPVAVAGGLVFASLAAGGYHTCGLTSAGTAYCWGDDRWGQLGDGRPANLQFTPVAVMGGLAFASLTGGNGYTCGLTGAGAAYCWGSNTVFGSEGVLGDGTTIERHAPTLVVGGLVLGSLTARVFHTCGLSTGGAAHCWGWNNNGQLGDSTTSGSTAPVPVVGGLVFASLTLDEYSTWGLTPAGALYCWGAYCTFPLPLVTPPTLVPSGLVFTRIAAGWGHICGLTSGGAAYCSGSNDGGQLGDGTTTDRNTFAPVVGGLVFVSLTSGLGHTCGLTAGGSAYCWGYNSDGQLGDGTTIARSVPTPVMHP